jgi:Tol biopolymer transport system component
VIGIALVALLGVAVGLAGCGGAGESDGPTAKHRPADPRLPDAPRDSRGEPLTGIFVVTPDGSRLRRIYPKGENPSWDPQGRRLAFEKDGDIWVLDLERRRAQKLVDDGSEPAWSPDGTHIAFVRWRRGSAGPGTVAGVEVVSADGTDARRVVDCRSPCWRVGEPAWSPDGSRMAFSREEDDPDVIVSAIYVASVEGDFETSVVTSPSTVVEGQPSSPAWSPDGTYLAFHREGLGVFALQYDGKRERLLIPEGELTDWDSVGSPSWSPSGRRIVVSKGFDDSEIYTRAVSGGPLRRVTTSGADFFSYTVDSNPAWSPDGRWIAFDRTTDSSLP